MASVVTLQQVQQWLETTKLTLSAYDPELEITAQASVFSAVAAQYDVTGWVAPASTPLLIREAIAMYVAAWTYLRAYSEDSPTENWYAMWLISEADTMIAGIVAGYTGLVEVPLETASTPSFWPTDAATQLALDSGPDAVGAAAQVFTIGGKY